MTTTDKTELLPTSGSPEFTPRDEYDPANDIYGSGPYDTEYESVGWDLSFGSRLNFDTDGDGNLRVLLNLSDDALANAMVCRNVTDVQVIAFARHLLALVKGDDDIETIAAKLAETAAQFNKRIAEKAEELAAPPAAEVRIEFGAWCHGENRDGIRLDEDKFSSRQQAAKWGDGQIGRYGITGYRVMCREHHVFAEGSRFATAITAWTEDVEEGR